MGFAEEMRAKWIADGLITTTNFYKGPVATIPGGAGPFVQFNQTGGRGDELTQNAILGYEKPSAQVIVTASLLATAETTAKALRNNARSVRNATLSGTWYVEITADQNLFDFPLDAAGRPRVGFNISAVKGPS